MKKMLISFILIFSLFTAIRVDVFSMDGELSGGLTPSTQNKMMEKTSTENLKKVLEFKLDTSHCDDLISTWAQTIREWDEDYESKYTVVVENTGDVPLNYSVRNQKYSKPYAEGWVQPKSSDAKTDLTFDQIKDAKIILLLQARQVVETTAREEKKASRNRPRDELFRIGNTYSRTVKKAGGIFRLYKQVE